VDQVHDDRDGDPAGGGLGLDLADLVLVPVGQRDPGPLTGGVAAVCLGEHGGDDGGGVIGDAGGQDTRWDRDLKVTGGGTGLVGMSARSCSARPLTRQGSPGS
jgi:hypothetical protein